MPRRAWHIVRGIVRQGLKPVSSKTSISLRVDADAPQWFKSRDGEVPFIRFRAKGDNVAKEKKGADQFVRYFGPLLHALRAIGGSAKPDEATDRIADDLKIPDQVLNEVLPSGGSRFRNQVAWARFHLVREGLLDSSKHGVWSLTEKGFKTSLTYDQSRAIFLKWVKIFQEQREKKEKEEPAAEKVAEGTGSLSKDYREEVLEALLKLPAGGFERLSQRLLREAGFTASPRSAIEIANH